MMRVGNVANKLRGIYSLSTGITKPWSSFLSTAVNLRDSPALPICVCSTKRCFSASLSLNSADNQSITRPVVRDITLTVDPPQKYVRRIFEVALMRWLINSTSVRSFSSRSSLKSPRGSEDGPGSKRPLKLMEFTERIWPSLFKSFKNFFMAILIRGYFDEEFTYQGFLSGVEQAVVKVSSLISRGKFEELDSLVTREAVREIEQNYRQLDAKQREFLMINPADLFLRFIYEIGIIMDDSTNKRYVEITAVIQGCHGIGALTEGEGGSLEEVKKNQDNLYVCNYRFIREYTKGISDDWTINKLNHFLPAELVQRYGPFDR